MLEQPTEFIQILLVCSVCVCVCVCVCVYFYAISSRVDSCNHHCAVLIAQLCPALRDPMDGSHQAPLCMGFSRTEYWSGLPCSRASSQPRGQTQVSYVAGGFFTV